jgi:transcriptional regulator with XRE-family HTH domain
VKIYHKLFSERLNLAMSKSGITQTHIVNKLGVEFSTVGRWVGGETIPKGDNLTKLAEMLDVPVNQLTGTDAPRAEPVPARTDQSYLDAAEILKALGKKGPVSRAAVLYLLTLNERHADRLRELGAGPIAQVLAKVNKAL